MTEVDKTDRTSYAPFVLLDGKYRSLILSDQYMGERFAAFEAAEWEGNGYDWNAIAQVVVTEQLPDLAGELTFDPEAGMFSASGSRAALERLGAAMAAVFKDEGMLRVLIGRAVRD